MRSINDRLQEMTEKINSGNVLESSGLGNEINFRVFDYDPEDEYVVRDYLYNYLLVRNKNIIVFDIYDIIIDILKEINSLVIENRHVSGRARIWLSHTFYLLNFYSLAST